MANNLQWSSISHLPDYVCNLLESHVLYARDPDYVDVAHPTRLPMTKERLDGLFFTVPWSANIKYDGTNVAITDKGEAYGRRNKIHGSRYQSKDVGFLFDLHPHVIALTSSLLGDLAPHVLDLYVYGEFMINSKFDYQEQGLYKKWYAFGICLLVKGDQLKTVHESLVGQGYNLNSIPGDLNGPTKLTVLLTDKLRASLNSHGIETAPVLYHGESLYEMITHCAPWMRDGNGEGVVCVGSQSQKKWKTGLEMQTSIFDHLRGVLASYESLPSSDLRIVEACKLLFEVKESTLFMGKPAGIKKKRKAAKRAAFFDAELVKAAILSALTKYDSLPTYFEAGTTSEIIQSVLQEVEMDLVQGDVPDDAQRELNNAVRKYVGIQYGKWKGEQPI